MTDRADEAANTGPPPAHAPNTEETGESADPQPEAGTQAGHTGADRPARERRQAPHLNPALQPVDPRPLRDIDHGRTGAMWTTVSIMLPCFLAAGIAMLWGYVTVMIVCGCVFLAGIITGIVLRARGYGLYVKSR
jgi:hypothetical protein